MTLPDIIFLARSLADRSPSSGQAMIFNATDLNHGNAYNTSTGIFTAPVSGTYSFHTLVCVNCQTAIVGDRVTYISTDTYDPDSHSCQSATADIMLRVNSKVWVKCTSAPSGDIFSGNNDYNTFTGYLLHL